MNRKAWIGVLGCAIALSACDDGNRPMADSTSGSASSTTDEVATTIPVTSVTETADPTANGSSSGSTDATDTDADTDDSTTGSTTETSADASSTTTGAGEESSSSTTDDSTTGNPVVWNVGWCNLQFPPTIAITTAETEPVYSRIYVEGLTDQTTGNDIHAQLVVEFGYGPDGSDPGAGEWSWQTGTGNFGWDGMSVGQPNNDEYTTDLQFAAPGTYDYAARVSGDGGTTWVYCDLDGLVEGGYTSDQAGDAVIE